MTKKRQAIISDEFIRDAAIALEAGRLDEYDIKEILQHFCRLSEGESGAPIILQRFVGLLLKKIFLGDLTPNKALGLESSAGRKALPHDRDGEICKYVAERIAEGQNLKEAKKSAEKKFNLGDSSIKGAWDKYKNYGIALFLMDRRKLNEPMSGTELAQLDKYAGKNIKGILVSKKGK